MLLNVACFFLGELLYLLKERGQDSLRPSDTVDGSEILLTS